MGVAPCFHELLEVVVDLVGQGDGEFDSVDPPVRRAAFFDSLAPQAQGFAAAGCLRNGDVDATVDRRGRDFAAQNSLINVIGNVMWMSSPCRSNTG